MSKAVFCSLFAAALALALAFRLAGLDLRPMHHDEANQAVRFGRLLETGEYRYDRNEHHGPTLYYLTLPAAWMRGQATLASLDERTLRIVPALFGAGAILLFSLLAGGLGRTSVVASALVAALSPALTYYSRFYIQESVFVFFALGFLIALGRYALRPAAVWAVVAGIFAGLAYSTKETSLIVLAAAVAACLLARPSSALSASSASRAAHATAALSAAASIAFLFYSSFLSHPAGILESLRAFTTYINRGIDPGLHGEPWHYYLGLLSFSSSGGLVWTEGLILGLALSGVVLAFSRTSSFWLRYVCLYSLFTAAVFSLVPYKTPWNVLPFWVGFVLLAGSGATALMEIPRSRVLRGLLIVAFAAAAFHLGQQNWRANFRYPADPRNPYVYAQTSPDFLRLAKRVTDLAALHPDGPNMLVKVAAGPYEQWPLPWYLRRMKRVGYWSRAAEAGSLDGVPVIIASGDNAGALDAALGDRYVSEFYGLRPGVLLTAYIERTLWNRFLQSRGGTT